VWGLITPKSIFLTRAEQYPECCSAVPTVDLVAYPGRSETQAKTQFRPSGADLVNTTAAGDARRAEPLEQMEART
jgi:hypothetical protein